MQMGVQLPTYWTDYGSYTVKEAIEETARAAEDLGYDSVWANDHVIASRGLRGEVGHIVEPLISLAALVNLVSRVDLGTSVLVLPQRNAVVVAKQAAALDVLSNGRLILGVGVGWNEPEYRFLNADFARRGAHADEAIQVMRALWRQEPEASYQGRFYTFEDAVFYPKPARGGPPVWIGGGSAAAIERAAGLGDAWCPYGIGLDAFRQGVASLRRRSQGRAPLSAAHLMLHLQADGSEPAGGAHISGNPEQVTATLQAYREEGLAYLVAGFVADDLPDLLRQAQTFAEEVAPHLRGG